MCYRQSPELRLGYQPTAKLSPLTHMLTRSRQRLTPFGRGGRQKRIQIYVLTGLSLNPFETASHWQGETRSHVGGVCLDLTLIRGYNLHRILIRCFIQVHVLQIVKFAPSFATYSIAQLATFRSDCKIERTTDENVIMVEINTLIRWKKSSFALA